MSASAVAGSVSNVAMEVMRDTFNAKMMELVNEGKHQCKLWTKERYDAVVEVCRRKMNGQRLVDLKNRTVSAVHQLARDYSLYVWQDNGTEKVFLYKISEQPRDFKDETGKILPQKLIRMCHCDEAFDLIRVAHGSTHQGPQKTHNTLVLTVSNISRAFVDLFCQCCHDCVPTAIIPKKGRLQPMYTLWFNSRGQVDLMDFSDMPDTVVLCKETTIVYKWILHYQDHGTKFSILRPLPSKEARTVALCLFEIFCLQGFPLILQSDNGKEFCNEVITALMAMSEGTKILHGRPRHPQSQGSVERGNGVVKSKLEKWLRHNFEVQKTPSWSFGLHLVQLSKNTSTNLGIKSVPYNLVYGHQIRRSVSDDSVLSQLIEHCDTEEELEILLNQNSLTLRDVSIHEFLDNDNAIQDSVQTTPAAVVIATPIHSRNAEVVLYESTLDTLIKDALIDDSSSSSSAVMCPGCRKPVHESVKHKCGHC